MIPPRILVIDDQLAAEAYVQEKFCSDKGLVPIKLTTSDRDLKEKCGKEKALAGAVFTSGQVKRGEFVENSTEEVRQAVRSGWPNDHAGWRWALVLLDLHFGSSPPQTDDEEFGFRILEELVRRWPDHDARPGNSELPIVMLSSLSDEQKKRLANQAGALAYIDKDADKKDPLTRVRLDALLNANGLIDDTSGILLGRSHAFLKLLREARRVARMGPGNAMILGPTGSGKTDLAQYIHRQSLRKEGPFIKYSIRATAESTEQTNLFGYWEGAFTGAAAEPMVGEAELAHEGILFLDEVHNSTTKLQNELLTYARPNKLGLREVRRVGGLPKSRHKADKAKTSVLGTLDKYRNILVNVLLLCATNEHLDDPSWRADHGFREDLYRRLATDYMEKPLRVPSLAERMEDVPMLFQRFLDERTTGKGWRTNPEGTKTVDPDVFRKLLSYSWPGNIAELHGVAHSVAFKTQSFVDVYVRHLPILDERQVPEQESRHASTPPSLSLSSAQPPNNLRDAEHILGNVAVPRSLRDLEGRLPSLKKAYGKLIRDILEAAFEEGKGPRSITPTMRRLFPGEIKDATQAYDKLLNLSDLFMRDNPPELDSQLGLAIDKADKNRRGKKAKKVSQKS